MPFYTSIVVPWEARAKGSSGDSTSSRNNLPTELAASATMPPPAVCSPLLYSTLLFTPLYITSFSTKLP